MPGHDLLFFLQLCIMATTNITVKKTSERIVGS